MAFSYQEEVSNGVQTVYAIDFDFRNTETIYVYTGEHSDYATQLSWRFTNFNTQVELTNLSEVPSGTKFYIRRIVDRTNLSYVFENKSMRGKFVDEQNYATLYLLQELMDGFGDLSVAQPVPMGLDMLGNVIKNLGRGTSPTDAATLGQVQEIARAAQGADTVVQNISDLPSVPSPFEGMNAYIRSTGQTFIYVIDEGEITGQWTEKDQLGDDVDVTAASRLTLAQAQASDLKEGQYVEITDLDKAPYKVVASSDTGGFYLATLASGNKLRLVAQSMYKLKWFGCIGNGSDCSAEANLAYSHVYFSGGGEISWTDSVYTVLNPILFASNTKTRFNKCTINHGDNQVFVTAKNVGGALVSNIGDAYSNAMRVDGSTFDAPIFNYVGANLLGGTAYRLNGFTFNCKIEKATCFNTERYVHANNSFFSSYDELNWFGNSDYVIGTCNASEGNVVINVSNEVALTLDNDAEFVAKFVPTGTVIVNVGPLDGAGAGRTGVVLSNPATKSVIDGGQDSGFASALNPVPLYEFDGACSDILFNKVSSGGRFVGLKGSALNSSTFNSCDTESCVIGYKLVGENSNLTFNSTHTENIYGWIWDCSESINSHLTINGYNKFKIGGVITAGSIGHVSGILNIDDKAGGGNTPYGSIDDGSPVVDLLSPNATMTVIGGTQYIGIGDNCKWVFDGGIKLANNPTNSRYVLDYYDQGEFIPSVKGSTTAGSATYAFQKGVYTRIGNRVLIEFTVTWSGHTGTGFLEIDGFPFLPSSESRVMVAPSQDLTYTAGQLPTLYYPGSGNRWQLYELPSSNRVNIDADGTIYVNAQYSVGE